MNFRHFKTVSATLMCCLLLWGCGVSLQEANKNFKLHQYGVAADMYEQVLKSDKELPKLDKQNIAFLAGEAHRQNHDSKNALKMYSKAITYGKKDAIAYFRKAEMLMEQGSYTEALTLLQDFKKNNPGDADVDRRIQGCELALKCADKKTRYIIENFKIANTTASDDRVARYADKKHATLMFTSDREEGESKSQFKWTGRMFEDLWMTQFTGRKGKEKWQPPVLVDGFGKFNEGVVTFDARYTTMYFTQCNGLEGKDSTCKIYEAKKRGDTWEVNPVPLPFSSDTYNCGHPALSPDGKQLFFVSDMEGSMQDEKEVFEKTKDIYVVNFVRRGKTWSDPINLGPTINTPGNELFPFVHADGSLYFSSDGHVTLGGLDIMSAVPKSESPTDWETPVNMGCPVNSQADDFGILVDENKEHGFFTSDRAKGDDDIYEFSMTPLILLLKGTVTDCDNKLPLMGASVLITNDKDSTKIRLVTNDRGYYETPLRIGVNYEIFVSKREDYYYDAKAKSVSTVGLEQSAEFVKDFCLENQCNDVFVLPIYYDLDKAFLREESKKVLDGLVATLKRYPKMSVELGSHTDCRSSYQYNIDLSQRRADSAVQYILQQGINPFRLEARGYGESQLVNDCACENNVVVPCSEEKHQENRRTTVKVVNCKYEFKWSNPEVQDTNMVAIEGGPVYSKVIIQSRKDFIKNKGSEYAKEIKLIEDEKKRQEEEAEKKRLAAMYDIIPLSKSRDLYYMNGNVGRKRIKFEFDMEGSRVEIPQSTVEQMLKTGDIKVSDFTEGREPIKLSDGTKVPSNSFRIAELSFEGVVLKRVRCKMVEDSKKTVVGGGIFSDYLDMEIRDDKLYLQKLEAEELEEEAPKQEAPVEDGGSEEEEEGTEGDGE